MIERLIALIGAVITLTVVFVVIGPVGVIVVGILNGIAVVCLSPAKQRAPCVALCGNERVWSCPRTSPAS